MAKKGKGFFGALGSALSSIPVVGKVKKAAKKKIKKAKKKLKKALKKAKKKLKKKLGKVLTKARKLKNNLSKSKLVKKFKKAVKKAVKKAKKYVKTVAKAVKKAAKTAVKAVKIAAKTTVNVAKSATKKATIAVKSVSISQAISTAADFIPVVGNVKAVFETAFGFDPFTLEKLSAVDRGIAAVGIIGGGYAKVVGKGGKTALNFLSSSKNATNATEAAAKSSKNSASAKGDVPKGTDKLIKFKGDEAIIHYEKHSKEIMDAMGKNQYNLKTYLEDANHVIQTGQYVPEMNGYVKLVGGKGSAKYGFVGLDRNTGNITTFHIKSVKELSKKAPSLGIETKK